MARLKNNRNQPLPIYYICERGGRKKVQIPSSEVIEVPDFVKPVSNGEVLNGWLTIMTEKEAKMMDAEKDVMGYIKSDKKTNK